MSATASIIETELSQSASPTLRVAGEELRILLSSEASSGAFALVEEVTPPGGGPPPHVHRHEDEAFLVLEGDYELVVGNRQRRLGPGDAAWGPRGVPHGFRNVGATPGRMIVVVSPGGFERFFAQVDALARREGPPPPEQLVALGARFGLEFLPPAT